MTKKIDQRTLASAAIEQAYYRGQREGIGQGLVIGLGGALIVYPTWVILVDWVREMGILPW